MNHRSPHAKPRNLGRIARGLTVSAVALLATAAAPVVANAGIWTPIPSGTPQDITALDHRGPGGVYYATSGGQLLKDGVLLQTAPGVTFNDLELNPSGTVGLAVGSNGTLRRSVGGGPWSLITLPKTYNHTYACSTTGAPFTLTQDITSDLRAVSWASDTVAYVVTATEGVVLKTTNGGANWTDVSRKPTGECFVGDNHELTDVAALPGSDLVMFVDRSFGGRWISSNGVTSSTARISSGSVNCFTGVPRIALEQENPNRSHVVGGSACNGRLAYGFSETNGLSYDYLTLHGGDPGQLTGLADVAAVGGSSVAVGNAGAILVSVDGRNMHFQRADGVDATQDWRAVDKWDAVHAAVGGRGGRLLVSSQANTIPAPAPVTPPTPPTPVPAPPVPPRTIPPGTRTPVPSQTVALPGGGTAKLAGPTKCVRPGGSFTTTLSWKRSKRKGSKLVRVTRTDFYIGKKRVKIDRKAPFRQKLTVKDLRPGTTHQLRARAFIKVKRGKAPTKSLYVRFSVCSS